MIVSIRKYTYFAIFTIEKVSWSLILSNLKEGGRNIPEGGDFITSQMSQ